MLTCLISSYLELNKTLREYITKSFLIARPELHSLLGPRSESIGWRSRAGLLSTYLAKASFGEVASAVPAKVPLLFELVDTSVSSNPSGPPHGREDSPTVMRVVQDGGEVSFTQENSGAIEETANGDVR